MDKVSIEEYKKGQKSLITIIVLFLIATAIVTGVLTNYKQETLVCSKSENICKIERLNLLNKKSQKDLVKFSDVKNVSYMTQKVRGNRFAKGYSSYLLIFNLKDNNPLVIFSSPYFEKEELDTAIKNLTEQINKNQDEIRLNRD